MGTTAYPGQHWWFQIQMMLANRPTPTAPTCTMTDSGPGMDGGWESMDCSHPAQTVVHFWDQVNWSGYADSMAVCLHHARLLRAELIAEHLRSTHDGEE